ncbi:hypothetical protein [Streptomyces lydicus]|uniref:hypothetical protein n=1 Tax=Streptomyces lydicus TaxID=47763 RepID=UPI0037A59B57
MPDRDHKPAADPDAPYLPLEPGEWDIPRVLLRHDRAVIAARVLTARLLTAVRTGRPLYHPALHHPTAVEQLLLFTQEQKPTAQTRPAVDLAALRTDLEALELTAQQLSHLRRAGQQLAALRKDAHQRAHQAAADCASNAQDAHAHRKDEQQAHRQYPYEPGRGHGATH